jgi:hypothetical protein
VWTISIESRISVTSVWRCWSVMSGDTSLSACASKLPVISMAPAERAE